MTSRRLTFAEAIRREEAGEDPVALMREAGLDEDVIGGVKVSWGKIARTMTRFYAWVRSGDPRADWCIIFLPVSFSEAERLDALRRILDRMDGPPIHRSKWNENRDRLLPALEDMGVQVEDLRDARGWEAVRTAVGDLTPGEVRRGTRDAERSVRSSLERLILEDLLGPEWRRKMSEGAVGLDHPDVPREHEAFHVVEARVEVDALLGAVRLTDQEREVLTLDRTGLSTVEISERLSTSPQAIRQARSDAIRKIRATLP